jgi:hypothetical protein
MAECWFRNPHNFIRELAEENATQIAWDRGALIKRKIDPVRHAELHFGQSMPWRLLLVGEQGTADLRPGYDLSRPAAVYPTWDYSEPTALLEELVTQPVGEDRSICTPGKLAPDETPVFGQEHRVVITNFPPSNTGPGKQFLRYLRLLQQDYPQCIIHLHGVYSWRIAFGIGIASADVDPRYAAQKGKVVLPSGAEVSLEKAQANPKWVSALGFKPVDLKEPRNRCLFNIRSAKWAAANFENLYALPGAGRRGLAIDPEEANPSPPKGTVIAGKLPKGPGDRFLCNTCSAQNSCSYFRDGAVCSVPGSEPVHLSQYFGSRDSEQIIEGLGVLMKTQTRRLEQGIQDEELEGELQPEVTKIINGLFDRGVTLAKLIDPGLRDPKLAINVGAGGIATVMNGSPQQLIAGIVAALEAKGIKRDQITPTMIENVMESLKLNGGDRHKAIEGAVIDQDGRAV